MTVLAIARLGDPSLRERAREVTPEELATTGVQRLIDDLIETMRDADGAGLAAPQVSVPLRIFVVEVHDNVRYPYKPAIPLRVVVNPVVELVGERTFPSYEGCLSVPDVRGLLERHFEIEIRYLDRTGIARHERVSGLSAGTFQHEADHLDGLLFLDRVNDPRTLAFGEEFRRFHESAWLDEIRGVIAQTSIS